MAVGNPFGQPLFNRLGLGGRFDGVNGTPSAPMADVVYRSTLGPQASLTALNQATAQSQGTMARVPGPNPFNGRPVPLLNPNQLPTGFGPSIVNTGNQIEPARQPDRFELYAAMTPEQRLENAQSELMNRRAKSPEELALYDSIIKGTFDPAVRPTGPGMAPANLSSLNPLNPNRPSGLPPNIGPLPNPDEGFDFSNPMSGLRPNIGPLPNPDEGFDFSNPMSGLRPPPMDPILKAMLEANRNGVPFMGNIGGNPPPPEIFKATPRPSAGTFNLDANSSGISPTGAGAHLLGGSPGQPFPRPGIGLGGISAVAFPTLAPSNTNTFTGAFGGNNPMNNNPMNGGGANSNQPLSQQIPQVVQEAVTPLLQNTATQLNQGIGSMVNQQLIGGSNQPFGPASGGPGQTLPKNMFLLGGFNPLR